MTIKKLEINDKKTELKVKLDKSLKSIILKLSITLFIRASIFWLLSIDLS